MDYDPKTMSKEPAFFVEGGILCYRGKPCPIEKTQNGIRNLKYDNKALLIHLWTIGKIEITSNDIIIHDTGSSWSSWSVSVPNTPKLYGELQKIMKGFV